MTDEMELICFKCKKPLQMRRVDFSYLGHNFHSDCLKCPECGLVYISEELAEGRIAEVEVMLEDK
ncbi:hypothetical protein UNSWDHB_452 [Dehalobacter sp. UNSWDHB]|uniref:DVU_1557 family redox protein n=1 Tax=Dehalobacter sp. UNSWDHB TaxID=1339256 RepID=UPI0003876056|nr:CLJU_RS11820 family redox protein [Dehalobacter sp. UNSWDHB]EQB22236.1 hypothetical protein UNSWDHB_452 [Dehalobacter sp. UNSWDHB]